MQNKSEKQTPAKPESASGDSYTQDAPEAKPREKTNYGAKRMDHYVTEVEHVYVDPDDPRFDKGRARWISELDAGAPWYLSRDEEAAIERHNQQYRQPATAEELLMTWFEPASRKKEYFMLATAILDELRQYVKASDMPSLTQLTMALRQCRFPYGAVNGHRGWYARTKLLSV